MIKNIINKFFITVLLLGLLTNAIAQNDTQKKAIDMLDNVVGKYLEKKSMSMKFEGIAYGIKDPKSIFTLPPYKIYRGGYVYLDNEQFEMQLGSIKSVCDGEVMVIVDEVSKMMYIDSTKAIRGVRDKMQEKTPDVGKLLLDQLGDGDIEYIGTEIINGKRCNKLRSTFTNGIHTLYWIDITRNQLYLMAEFQNGMYDVYWFSQIAGAPKNYEYKVNISDKPMTKFYGYEVIDNRYTYKLLK